MLTRRTVITGLAGLALGANMTGNATQSSGSRLTFKSGEVVPPIGMGTWLTFNIGLNNPEITSRQKVLDAFYAAGGGMIDSSPMYGRAESVIGHLMEKRSTTADMFSATKIWTPMTGHGHNQLENSHTLWGEPVLDLVHVHNLVNWDAHSQTLRAARDRGDVRYIGLTTSHGRRHSRLVDLMRREPLDAVQFTYNILDREAENRLLPVARDKGLTVIINRPFRGGQLFDHVNNRELPTWAVEELSIQSWAEYFLKFIIAHPAVNIAIPATSRPDHMAENMRARLGPLPDAKQRRKMIRDMSDA